MRASLSEPKKEFKPFFAMERDGHNTSHKISTKPTMNPLAADDPRCDGIQVGTVRLQCDTCGFVTGPIKDAKLNKYRAQQRAEAAHKQCYAIQPHATNQPSNPLLTSDAQPLATTPLASGDTGLSAGLTPMTIDQSQSSTTTQTARMENTLTQQLGFTMNVTDGRVRMADGTSVEGTFELKSEGSTVQTEIAEYKQQIIQLKTQCQAIESARVEAVNDSLEQKSGKEFFSTVVGKPILDAVADKKSGMELMFSGLTNVVLLKAVNTLVCHPKSLTPSARASRTLISTAPS